MGGIMAAAWFVHERTGNAGWADTFWSFGVGITSVIGSTVPVTTNWRQWVVCLAAGLWGVRLGCHIAARTCAGSNDPRYAELTREWGAAARLRMFYFLQCQAVVGAALAIAVMLATRNPALFPGSLDVLGVCLFVVSIAGEALADVQLKNFKARAGERRKVCNVGLWSWSRHPNYFFEWLFWLGIAFIAIDPSGAYNIGYAAVGAPLLMYYVLVHVSGIPPLEQHMLHSRGDEFRRYQALTSSFLPLPPKA